MVIRQSATPALLVCLVISWLIAAAGTVEAATLWEITSETNDPVGLGQNRLVDESTGTFAVEPGQENGLLITYDEGEVWTFGVAPSQLGSLTVGYYQTTRFYPFPGLMEPAQKLTMAGRECLTSMGWYAIHELVFDGGGNVIALAIDYGFDCPGDDGGQTGKIRFNSAVDLGSDNPIASAGDDFVVPEDRTANLDGSFSWVAQGSIASYQWTQISGVPVVIQNDANDTAQFTAPDVTPGGEMLTFQLEVTTDTNKTHLDTVSARVTDASDEQTVISIDTTSSLGSGVSTRHITPDDGTITSIVRPGSFLTQIDFRGDIQGDRWSFDFSPRVGQSWSPGDYRGALRFSSETNPGLSINTGCSSTVGRFVIYELTIAADESLELFAADFEYDCDYNDESVVGRIRINSTIPVYSDIPWASAGDDQRTSEGDVVTLDAGGSSIGYGAIAAYSWQQLSGPTVQVVDSGQIQASFTAPIVEVRGSDLVFEATATSDTGKSDTTEVKIHVSSKSDPQSYFSFASESGDAVGGGTSRYYSGNDWDIVSGYAYSNGANISISQPGSGPGWTAEFVAANDLYLAPGFYDSADRFPSPNLDRNRMDVHGDGSSCSELVGSFNVLDIEYQYQATVRLAIDFQQNCVIDDIVQPGMTGKVRVNYVDASVPTADAGRDLSVAFGDAVSIDGSASQDVDGSISEYDWRQIAGLPVTLVETDQSSLQFDAPTDLQSGSMPQFLVFELLVTDDLGYQDWDVVNVTVGTNANPIAIDDDFVVDVDTTSSLTVLDNDYDPDNDAIDESQVMIVAGPLEGSAAVDTSDGTISYIPSSGFLGFDSLQYEIIDGAGMSSDAATVSITVNTPPVARNDSASVVGQNTVAVSVLNNDSDFDDFINRNSVAIVTQPENGTATVRAGGAIEYVANLGFSGSDSFSYSIRDNRGSTSNEATVRISVSLPTTPPPNNGGGSGGGSMGLLFLIAISCLGVRRRVFDYCLRNPSRGLPCAQQN